MGHHPVLPGAEPWSAAGGTNGALVLHGFTGSPQSMRSLAEALADAGFTVELPLLPGHGTAVDDMAGTCWDDWAAAVDDAYLALASRCDRVVVCGLSMGGALALWLAVRHPEIAGLAVVNPVTQPLDESIVELARDLLQKGEATMPGIGSDIAHPERNELAYDAVPLQCLLSLGDGMADLAPTLATIEVPLLVLNAPQDHVVPPSNSETLTRAVRGPVERVSLDRSYHVATLDHDQQLIEERVVEFASRVVAT